VGWAGGCLWIDPGQPSASRLDCWNSIESQVWFRDRPSWPVLWEYICAHPFGFRNVSETGFGQRFPSYLPIQCTVLPGRHPPCGQSTEKDGRRKQTSAAPPPSMTNRDGYRLDSRKGPYWRFHCRHGSTLQPRPKSQMLASLLAQPNPSPGGFFSRMIGLGQMRRPQGYYENLTSNSLLDHDRVNRFRTCGLSSVAEEFSFGAPLGVIGCDIIPDS